MKRIIVILMFFVLISATFWMNMDSKLEEKLRKEEKNEPIEWEKSPLIGHAFYEIDGISYTNSKEAFLNGYEKGLRTFEVDLELTKDEKVVLVHYWNQYGEVFQEKEFLNQKINGIYTPMSFKDLLTLMEEYKNIWIVTDSKYTTTEEIKKEFNEMLRVINEEKKEYLLNRFIIQIYNEQMLSTVKEIYPFKNIIFTLYMRWNGEKEEFEEIGKWSKENNVKAITMWNYLWDEEIQNIGNSLGLDIYVHTENNKEQGKYFIEKGVAGLYTDNLTLKDVKDIEPPYCE